MKDSHIATKIRNAVQKENAETLLKLIHENMHIEQYQNGESYVVYHNTTAHEVIEEISAALVDFDAGDLFREMCLQDGMEYNIANLPAAGDINILDLAEQKNAKSLAEAIQAQDGKEKLKAKANASFAPKKAETVPQYLIDLQQSLSAGYGADFIRGFLKNKITTPREAEEVVFAALNRAVDDGDVQLAGAILEQAVPCRLVSHSTLQTIANIAGKHAFDEKTYPQIAGGAMEIACMTRDAIKARSNLPQFAAPRSSPRDGMEPEFA